MTIEDYIVFGFWSLLPALQLLLVLYNILEWFSGKKVGALLKDDSRQLGFLLLCLLVAWILDLFVVDKILEILNLPLNYLELEIPKIIVRLMLFPAMLFVGAKILGGAKPIEIPKNPRLKYNRDKEESK